MEELFSTGIFAEWEDPEDLPNPVGDNLKARETQIKSGTQSFLRNLQDDVLDAFDAARARDCLAARPLLLRKYERRCERLRHSLRSQRVLLLHVRNSHLSGRASPNTARLLHRLDAALRRWPRARCDVRFRLVDGTPSGSAASQLSGRNLSFWACQIVITH